MLNLNFSVHAGSLKRYRNLVILVGLFLALTVAMLGISSVVTRYFAGYAHDVIDISIRQGTLVQQISKNLIDTDLYITEKIPVRSTDGTVKQSVDVDTLPQAALYRLEEIKQYRNQFEETLSAFQKGGEVPLPEGGKITVDKIKDNPVAEKHLENIRRMWDLYLGMLDNYLRDAEKGFVNAQTSAYLVDYTRLYNRALLAETDHFTESMHIQITREAGIWQIIQLLGIILAFILFGLIIFGALRHLADSDRKLEMANREMGEIMSSVREGLFLVDKDFFIGHEYSTQLETILDEKNLGGKNFLDVVSRLVPKSELENTKTFVEQLYNDWVVENLIEDLNPLHRISVVTESSPVPKYLDFKFFRVMNGDIIERVLVSVVDSTETVLLQSSIEAQKEQEKRELEMLNTILNTDGMVLDGFIRVSKKRLDEINTALKSPETGQMELKTKVNYIGRSIHSIKGEASALHLGRMVDICHTVEDTLSILRKQPSLSGQDFLSMVVLLEDLYRLVDILENYSERLNQTDNQQAVAVEKPSDTPASVQFAHAQALHLKQFVEDIAERAGKKVSFIAQGFDQEHKITIKQWQALQDIAMQVLRNAIVHGIEVPQVRQARRKPEAGRLKLAVAEDENSFTLIAEDDGNGIDFEAIRKQAVDKGIFRIDAAADLTKNQLLMVMLNDGFSTLPDADEDGGRGIGMGIVKETVHRMGGKMNIATAKDQYTRFSIKFPKAKKS